MPKFMGRADGTVFAWCPALHLLCVSMYRMSLWVYRPNGERIYAINNRSPIRSVRFADDGLKFAVSGDDNKIKIYDSNTGELCGELNGEFDNIRAIDWHHITSKARRPEDTGLDKYQKLIEVDLVSQLPRLSDEMVSTDSIDYIVVADAANVGYTFDGLLNVTCRSGYSFVDHLQNGDFFTQVFVNDTNQLVPVLTQLEDAEQRNHFMKVVRKLCQLLKYKKAMKESWDNALKEVDPFIAALDRYLGLLRDELDPECQGVPQNVTTSYFEEYVITGLVDPVTKDFWLNQMGERGYKLLSKLASQCYDNLAHTIFSQVVIALERILIIAQDLFGLCRWVADSESPFRFGLNESVLKELVTSTQKQIVEVFELLRQLNVDKTRFFTWLEWIKFEFIDKLAKEDEIQQYYQLNGPEVKLCDILKFLQNQMGASTLFQWFPISTQLSFFEPTILNGSYRTLVDTSKLITDFQEFFGQVFYLGTAIELSVSRPHLLMNETDIVAVSTHESILEIAKFDPVLLTASPTLKLVLPRPSLEVQLTNSHIVVMTTVEILRLAYGEILNDDINFQVVHQIQLANPSRLAIDESQGCVLGTNHQDYEVFRFESL
ncbi:hypothetical protein DIURU_005059 [Diutina rugosa]|uniref:Anaphase-promoting complex subunit 4 n=1 Tax=Diutina rugosa TaxID=5481 RepID=A0A642UG19_DIURU|nr:uncharacterized protein DIURU_005059 [Diutina rugosa]KAA8898204.1 hypothetical protein DIURU_005059 [Diutina rugosa]